MLPIIIAGLENPSVIAALVITVLTCLYFIRKCFFDPKVPNIAGKYVFITGCDSGFGKMAAERLDQLGFHVIATCFTREGEDRLVKGSGGRIITFRLDVTKTEQVREVFLKVKKIILHDQGLWGVLNNAGIALVGPVDWVPLEQFRAVADVGLWGLIDVTKTFLPLVKKAKGRIVNLTSIAGRMCLPNVSTYSIAKYGAEAFSDAIRRELAVFGIKVSIIEPGFFTTEMTNPKVLEKGWVDLWNSLDKEVQDEYGEQYCQTCIKNMLSGVVDICCSPHTYKVIDAITHALTSTNPKPRYVIGWDSRLLWVWLSRLPTRVGDIILGLLAEKATPASILHKS